MYKNSAGFCMSCRVFLVQTLDDFAGQCVDNIDRNNVVRVDELLCKDTSVFPPEHRNFMAIIEYIACLVVVVVDRNIK